jgi:hypothetical protein
VRHLADEFRQPRQLVPVRQRVEQKRRIAFEQPAERLDESRRVIPDFGVAGGQLTAIGERRFHCRVTMAVEDGHPVAVLEQRVGCGNAGDTGSNNGDVCHDRPPQSDMDPIGRSRSNGPHLSRYLRA